MKKEKKYNIIILRILFTFLLIVNCVIIYVYSGQDGIQSRKVSVNTTNKIINVIGKKENDIKIKKFEKLVRKIAHFSIYTSLGIWSGCLLSTYFSEKNEKERDKKRISISIIIGFLYACSDEIHQLFSSGRAGRIIDVIIDTIGVANGVLISILILKIVELLKNNKETE